MALPRSSSTANVYQAPNRSTRSGRRLIAHWRPRAKSRLWRARRPRRSQGREHRPEIRRAISFPRRMLLSDPCVANGRCVKNGRRVQPASSRLANGKGSIVALLSVIAIAAGVAGCTKEHGPDVVAMVNGKPIMRADMERLYKTNLGESKQEPPKDQADNVRLNIVREQIDEEIVDQRAAKLNLTATDDEVE